MLIEGKNCSLETDDPVKGQAMVDYMDYTMGTPEFKEKLRQSYLHFIDTGEIKYVE